MLGGVLPLFSNQMYKAMGTHYATTMSAAVTTVFCATPFLCLRYAKRLGRGVSLQNLVEGGVQDEWFQAKRGETNDRPMENEEVRLESLMLSALEDNLAEDMARSQEGE